MTTTERKKVTSGPPLAPPDGESRLTEEDMIQRPDEDVGEYINRIQWTLFGDYVFDTDAADLIRAEREARSEHLATLSQPKR